MYYHVVIKLIEKNKKDYSVTLSELDLENLDDIVNDTVLPYLEKTEFLFDGQMLTKNHIESLKIFETNNLSQELVNIEDSKPRDFVWITSKQDVVTYDKYSKDITKQVFKKAQTNNSQKETKITHEYDKSKVFIVHGHDNEAKTEVARFIEKIGFEPIILHEQANSSKTIIEKIESYSNVGFGVVLYTACDVGAKQSESSNLNNRARQNVVFEHGFLIGKLGRKNVCQFVKGDIETPNDISGVVYISMDSRSWQIELAKEMRASGYSIDMNKVI